MAILDVANVSKAFGGLRAVSDVTFSVPEGSIFAVIGPNGAGKTSLFNCISAVYRPQKGSIQFEGRELVGERAHRAAEIGRAHV